MKRIKNTLAYASVWGLIGLVSTSLGGELDFPEQPPVAPLQRNINLPQPYTTTLENGMDIIVVANSELPWITMRWYLQAGAKFDPPLKPGVAYLTALTLDEGTKKYTSDDMSEMVDFHAIRKGGSTTHETSYYSSSCLKDKVTIAIELMAEAIRHPIFPERDFKRIQSQEAQRLTIQEQDGAYQANRTFRNWAYGNHYLARPANGTSATLGRIPREELVEFHQTHYMPNNSTLVFSGDIEPEQAVGLAQKYFGGWQRGIPAQVPQNLLPGAEKTQIVIVDRRTSKQAQIRIGHLGFKRDHPNYEVSRVFNQVFGGGFVSRLNKRVRVEEGNTYGAQGYFNTGKEPGTLTVSTFTRTEEVGNTVKILLEEINKIRDIPPTAEELSDSKNYLVGSFSLSLETPQQMAQKIWDLKFHSLPFDYYESYFNKIDQMTSEQVQTFSQKHVDPDKLKIVIVGNAEEIQPQLEGLAPITVIKPGKKVPTQAKKSKKTT